MSKSISRIFLGSFSILANGLLNYQFAIIQNYDALSKQIYYFYVWFFSYCQPSSGNFSDKLLTIVFWNLWS